MTKSTITRERLEELASGQSGFNLRIATLEESQELASMALAAMDSEYHTDDELSNLLWYSQEAACHSDPNYHCEFQRLATPGLIAGIIRELQERCKADSEPVAWLLSGGGTKNVVCFDSGNAYADPLREVTPLYRHAQQPVLEREPIAWLNDAYLARGVVDGEAGSEDAGPGYIPVYREAGPQPAPVVPEALERLRSMVADPKRLPRRKEWIGGQQYSYVLLEEVEAIVDEACRAAMLQAGTPTNEGTRQVDELTMWIKRLVRSLKNSNPDSKLPREAMDYLTAKGLISVGDILR
ncbi:hypothetical protein [Klebsiella variicola]|uniref:hypothetical protein n=1 Tax=Klebsiella variicola TaxID=244366 RepID=UPI002B05F80E|nr:hypothetical protein [Klebsiella variicola]